MKNLSLKKQIHTRINLFILFCLLAIGAIGTTSRILTLRDYRETETKTLNNLIHKLVLSRKLKKLPFEQWSYQDLLFLTPENGHLYLKSTDKIIPSPGAPELEQLKITPFPLNSFWVKATIKVDNNREIIAFKKITPESSYLGFMLRPLFAVTMIWVGLLIIFSRWVSKLNNNISGLTKTTNQYSLEKESNTRTALQQLKFKYHDELSMLRDSFLKMVDNISKLYHQDKRLFETLDLMDEGVLELDERGYILSCTNGWKNLISNSPQHEYFWQYLHPEERNRWRYILESLTEGKKQQSQMRLRLDLDSRIWIETSMIADQIEDGIKRVRLIVRNITTSYMQEKRMVHMALHDALTKLPNRILLEEHLNKNIAIAQRNQSNMAVVFIDLDHFKDINDTLGHSLGDELLSHISKKLEQLVRKTDTLARWGGDEFVLLISDINDSKQAESIVRKVLKAIRQSVQLGEHQITMGATLGIALYPADGESKDVLFSAADRAMYYAKQQGRNQYVFYSDIKQKLMDQGDIYIQSALSQAVKAQKIQVWFQPIINPYTNKVNSVEALARWKNNKGEWISPATFIPVAENLGIICELGEQVFIKSFDAIKQLQKKELLYQININISARQLFTRTLQGRIYNFCLQNNIQPGQIIIEITESLAMQDIDYAYESLHEFEEQGFQIAIDDFGTGHSSLAQLTKLKVDKLKIDKGFIQQLDKSHIQTIVKAIVSMAKELKLHIVAEGIETQQQLDLLKQYQVDSIQGYYYAKPMPLEELIPWLENYKRTGMQDE